MNPPIPPPTPETSIPLQTPPAVQVAKWRWLLAFLVIGSYPLLSIVSHLVPISGATREGPALPDNVPQLLLFCLLQLGIFGVFWAVAWVFARPRREHIGWEWHGQFQPVGWGFLYFLALRLAPAFVVIAAVILASAAGITMNQIQQQIMQNRPDPEAMVATSSITSDPLYLLILTTFVSFVVAGLREELWRAFSMTALMKLLPASMSLRAQQVLAVVVTAIIFGAGHIAQGPIGVVLTGVLGLLLGAAILIHRSIWPAVIAHGLFDASTFMLLPLASYLQKSGMVPKMLLGWMG